MIEVITQYNGWSAEQMERAITLPIEIALQGMPGLTDIRSLSIFGLSDVKVYFDFGTEYFRDRQEVLNRLQTITLPQNVQPASLHGRPSPKYFAGRFQVPSATGE